MTRSDRRAAPPRAGPATGAAARAFDADAERAGPATGAAGRAFDADAERAGGRPRSGSLGTLIAVKLVCCGGLLAATGAVSLGGALAFLSHPAAIAGGVVLLAGAGWMAARRSKAAGACDGSGACAARPPGPPDDPRRDAA